MIKKVINDHSILRKENGDFPVATPPTSPQKFSPSVTITIINFVGTKKPINNIGRYFKGIANTLIPICTLVHTLLIKLLQNTR